MTAGSATANLHGGARGLDDWSLRRARTRGPRGILFPPPWFREILAVCVGLACWHAYGLSRFLRHGETEHVAHLDGGSHHLREPFR